MKLCFLETLTGLTRFGPVWPGLARFDHLLIAGLPTGTNCWMWELDPVEGTSGWSPGKPLPGNLNMAYSTEPLGLVMYLWCSLTVPLVDEGWIRMVWKKVCCVVSNLFLGDV